jgi:hypothetical protein
MSAAEGDEPVGNDHRGGNAHERGSFTRFGRPWLG